MNLALEVERDRRRMAGRREAQARGLDVEECDVVDRDLREQPPELISGELFGEEVQVAIRERAKRLIEGQANRICARAFENGRSFSMKLFPGKDASLPKLELG